MISLCKSLPRFFDKNAEYVKLRCLFESYPNDNKVLFWTQNKDKALISLTDGNMIIYNRNADLTELKEFVSVINPVCVYSDYETLCALDKRPCERINVMFRECDIKGASQSDSLSSKQLYELLSVEGLSLPEYPFFAVDYCHRLNIGKADYFGKKDKGAIVSFNCGDMAIINGIASRQKGFGSEALRAILQKNYGRTLLVCCRDKVKGFYEKNGFKFLYYAGYWIKEIEN